MNRRKKLLSSIADAFGKIHDKDRRVTRINMPKECFWELVTRKDSLTDLLNPSDSLPGPLHKNHLQELGRLNISDHYPQRPDSKEFLPETAGKIWGANVYFTKDKLEVLSDDVRYRAGKGIQWPEIERVSPTINEPVDLNIKFFYMGNLTIHVKSRARPIVGISAEETKAIDTLREMITEADFRKYIIHGFILVKGRSGRIYQIFRNRNHTIVWEKGIIIEEVCVRIKDTKIPPTDSLIAFKILIETSEDEFRKLGNVYNMRDAA